MNATIGLYGLGACLLAATMVVSPAGSSWFEARTTGARELTLSGDAEFGLVGANDSTGPFVITLGAESPTGAVVFTRQSTFRPGPGVYRLGEKAAETIQALVVTGSPEWPTGAYRARAGSLTITRSEGDYVAGHFEIQAVGYDADDPLDEARTLSVQGTFTALPTR